MADGAPVLPLLLSQQSLLVELHFKLMQAGECSTPATLPQ